MAAIAAAAIVVAGGAEESRKARRAAKKASEVQVGASRKGIKEERYQFDQIQKLLQPYVTAGSGAVGQQQALIGLSGPQAQQQAISGIESSPLYGSLVRQGEESILQNAAATGGLRGGNTQGALAQFRPAILQQLIENQYQKLGGIAQLGQASAAGVGSAGLQTGSNIANLLGQQGQAQAGQAIASGRADAQFTGDITQAIGTGVGAYLNRPAIPQENQPLPNQSPTTESGYSVSGGYGLEPSQF